MLGKHSHLSRGKEINVPEPDPLRSVNFGLPGSGSVLLLSAIMLPKLIIQNHDTYAYFRSFTGNRSNLTEWNFFYQYRIRQNCAF
jgi:hypothetical protein